jgi:hypothetical protein
VSELTLKNRRDDLEPTATVRAVFKVEIERMRRAVSPRGLKLQLALACRIALHPVIGTRPDPQPKWRDEQAASSRA